MMYMDPMFFTRYLSLDAEAILHGQVWRLVTFLLYPPTLSPFWIIFAALMYYSLGRSLEAVWGAFRFNVFFFMGAIGIIPVSYTHLLQRVMEVLYLRPMIFSRESMDVSGSLAM